MELGGNPKLCRNGKLTKNENYYLSCRLPASPVDRNLENPLRKKSQSSWVSRRASGKYILLSKIFYSNNSFCNFCTDAPLKKRSFLFKESLQPLDKPPALKLSVIDGIELFVNTVFNSFAFSGQKEKPRFQEVQPGQAGLRNAWRSELVFRRLQATDQTLAYSKSDLLAIFAADFETFLAEFTGVWKAVAYYQVGEAGSYRESGLNLGANQVEELKQRGLNFDRANLELANWMLLDQFLNDPTVQAGEILIWVSPPGSKAEGYLGSQKKSHSFIYVYQKTNSGGGIRYIYRSYASLDQLFNWQNALLDRGQNYGDQSQLLISSKASKEQQIIARLIRCNALNIDQIEQEIYAEENSWPTVRKDLPQFDQSMFDLEKEKVFSLFLTELEKLLDIIIDQAEAGEAARNDDFWHSADFYSITQRADLLFAISYQALLKWIEYHDPRFNQQLVLTQKNEKGIDQSGSNQVYSIDPANLLYFYQEESKKTPSIGQAGRQSITDHQRLQAIKEQILASPSSVLGQLVGVSECGLGAMLDLGKMPYTINSAGQLIGPCGLPLSPHEIEALGLSSYLGEKQRKKSLLGRNLSSQSRLFSQNPGVDTQNGKIHNGNSSLFFGAMMALCGLSPDVLSHKETAYIN